MSGERDRNFEVDAYPHIRQVIAVQQCAEGDSHIVWEDSAGNKFKHIDPKYLSQDVILLGLQEQWHPLFHLPGEAKVKDKIQEKYVRLNKKIIIPITGDLPMREYLLQYLESSNETLEDNTRLVDLPLAYAFSHKIISNAGMQIPTVEVTLFKRALEYATLEERSLSQIRAPFLPAGSDSGITQIPL